MSKYETTKDGLVKDTETGATGVFRTVGGRRIFIKEGQDLASAMKESGKFSKKQGKGKEEDKKNNKENRIKELEKQKEEAKGFLAKAKVQEEIDALNKGYESVEEYRKAKEEKHKEALEKSKAEKEERMKIKSQQEKEEQERGYMMAHRPDETGATGDDLTKGDVALPKDFYNHPENYGNMEQKDYKESFEVLKKIKGNPNAEVTIYRATTGDSINDGDWITLSKEYADIHNKHSLQSKGKILKMKVKASEIRFAGDDIREFGYFPKKKK